MKSSPGASHASSEPFQPRHSAHKGSWSPATPEGAGEAWSHLGAGAALPHCSPPFLPPMEGSPPPLSLHGFCCLRPFRCVQFINSSHKPSLGACSVPGRSRPWACSSGQTGEETRQAAHVSQMVAVLEEKVPATHVCVCDGEQGNGAVFVEGMARKLHVE